MSEQLFDVVFFGILQTGKDKEIVMQNMAALFKTDVSKLAAYFAGGRKVIKGNINADTAEKYQTALENVGLVVKLEPSNADQNRAEKEEPQTTAAKQPAQVAQDKTSVSDTSADAGNISIAPVGADVLENPVEIPAQKIDDISALTMAEAGADVIENPVEVAAQEIGDISDISMAEVGSDVLDHPQQVIPQKINDISDISLADTGYDLIENPKPKEKADIPDTSELSLDSEKG